MYKLLSGLVLVVLFSNFSYGQTVIVQPIPQPVYYVQVVPVPVVPIVPVVQIFQPVIVQPNPIIINPPYIINQNYRIVPQPYRCCIGSMFYKYWQSFYFPLL